MLTPNSQARRAIPAVDTLLKAPAFGPLIHDFGRSMTLECLRGVLSEQRRRLALERGATAPDEDTLAAECRERLAATARPSLRPVFNLTGTVLHTNLGRALYPAEAVAAAVQAMARPVNLEYDLDGAGRGERDSHVEDWLLRADRRRGGSRRQQQRRRGASSRSTPLAARPRGGRVARRAGRDRRRVPHARHHGARRLRAARGRHDQPHAPARLRRARSAPRTARADEGACQQLRDPAASPRRCSSRGAGRHRARARRCR